MKLKKSLLILTALAVVVQAKSLFMEMDEVDTAILNVRGKSAQIEVLKKLCEQKKNSVACGSVSVKLAGSLNNFFESMSDEKLKSQKQRLENAISYAKKGCKLNKKAPACDTAKSYQRYLDKTNKELSNR